MYHGYLRGYAATSHQIVTRGIRFFCSDRFAKGGCGKTFSIFWANSLPHTSLRTKEFWELLELTSLGKSLHNAWASSRLQLSLRSAYRWVKRFKLSLPHIRSRLYTDHSVPKAWADSVENLTLKELHQLFAEKGSPISVFQLRYQQPFLI